MKVHLLPILVAISISTTLHAQKLRTLYYTDRWELTTKDSADYYRICSIDTLRNEFIGAVKDFTTDGKLLMSGSYQDGIKNGPFTFYYPSGQIESQGEFKNNSRDSVWIYFYENGQPYREIKFLENEDFFVNSLYDTNGKLIIKNGTGEWLYTYDWYGLPLSLTVTGFFLDGKKEGEWRCSYSDGTQIYKETFNNGNFKKGLLLKSGGSVKEEYPNEFPNKFLAHYKHQVTEDFRYRNGITRNDYSFLRFLPEAFVDDLEIDSLDASKVFLVVDQPPEYVGGLEAMYNFISKNLKYPASAKNLHIEGNVFVAFVVEPDGSIGETSVIKGIHKACDQEAIRVVKMMPKWKPGSQRGRPVKVRFAMPIKFRID